MFFFLVLAYAGFLRKGSLNGCCGVVIDRRQLPPPLPCAAAADKSAEYVNGMVPEPVRRTSSLDCLNNPPSSSSSSSSAAAAAANASVDCAPASLTDAGPSL